ncbi:hypothetical protein CLIB1444_01S17172 [[Candida] jaroonii]|uniref:Uncharacterized protein n=1 Tax=[Candida] jaroonii TaxID=467808 RepID=A0ACA9Y1S5_9ASCO|nr:hypothetical protein CLIB1444_01S17172 [[Candida] jaroonii]
MLTSETVTVSEESIINCETIDQLNSFKTQLSNLQYEGTTNYDRQRFLNKIETLNKLIESKKSSLSETKFQFQGQPQKLETYVNTNFNEFKIAPYKEGIEDETLLIDHTSHLVIKDFRNCLIKDDFKSSSVNLIDGEDSKIKIFINGTIYLNNLHNCILHLQFHQLRIHNCSHLSIKVNSAQTLKDSIIIENCKELLFNKGVKVHDFDSALVVSNNYQLVDLDNMDPIE